MAIEYAVSLGIVCHATSWINQMDLKRGSYPFDWICSSTSIVLDCIEGDFKKFLDRDLHIPNGGDPCNLEKSGHKFYGANILYHHNIRNDEKYSYFVRCVKRFRLLLKKPGRKLYVISYINKRIDLPNSQLESVKDIYKGLEKVTSNFEMLLIYHRIGDELETKIDRIDGITIIQIYTTTTSHGTGFYDMNENTFFNESVFNLYQFDIFFGA